MTTNIPQISQAVAERFVGRQDALNIFYQRFAYRHIKNVVYYYADGGTGKTWILQKILQDNQNDPIRRVKGIIDFFDTQNQSVEGLQATIRTYLEVSALPSEFQAYDAIIQQLKEARSDPNAKTSGLLASLENRANRLFLECCQQATTGREVVLLFDTFEKVQERYVGNWLLRDFLPQVRGLVVAIAGRPVPTLANVPDNAVSLKMGGLGLNDVQEYIQKTWPLPIPLDVIERIWKRTQGVPLLMDLIFDLTSEKYIRDLNDLNTLIQIKDDGKLKREITNRVREQLQHEDVNDVDRVIWAMAYLRRRFDLAMLRYIIEYGELFGIDLADYPRLVKKLDKYKFVKEYPALESHLLHDEMQRIVAEHWLDEEDPRYQIRDSLFDLIVLQYYPKYINENIEKDPALVKQLQAEQFGYILDRCMQKHNFEPGMKQFYTYRTQIERENDYDFEELLWGELRDHLDGIQNAGYDIASERGQWLRRHNLFAKAEQHYMEMWRRFPEQHIEITKSLGFSLMRQGKLQQAISSFEQGLVLSRNDIKQTADFENLLGQAYRAAGRWNAALRHYTQGLRAFTLTRDKLGMAGIYVNRAYLYSLQGLASDAIHECNLALKLLDTLPSSTDLVRRLIYAHMNLGTAYRHGSDHKNANLSYQKSLLLARSEQDREATCRALQQLGINTCLQGRILNREGKELVEAAKLQLQAWRYLAEALEIAQVTDWKSAIADGLSRMAEVYEEIYRLLAQTSSLDAVPPELNKALMELQAVARTFQPAVEVEYQYELLQNRHFSELDWLEKTTRLYELSALIADEANDFHRALDSLMDFARLLLELKHYSEVPIIVRRSERIKGFDYQADLFSAMGEITLANLAYEQGKLEIALNGYAIAFATVAKQTGYATYLLTDRLHNLEMRIRNLPSEVRLRWTDVLEQRWLEQSVSSTRPDMLRMLEAVRFETMS